MTLHEVRMVSGMMIGVSLEIQKIKNMLGKKPGQDGRLSRSHALVLPELNRLLYFYSSGICSAVSSVSPLLTLKLLN